MILRSEESAGRYATWRFSTLTALYTGPYRAVGMCYDNNRIMMLMRLKWA